MTDIGQESDVANSSVEIKNVEKSCGNGINIKEEGITVKKEHLECTLCMERSADLIDINTKTQAGTFLHEYLSKYTQVDLSTENNSKQICKNCFDLIDILEQTEAEYMKLKIAFEAILSKNPLFEIQLSNINIVKSESSGPVRTQNSDSEDEPLSLTKKKRVVSKPESKKNETQGKRKVVKNRRKLNDESWECKECNAQGSKGGQAALVSHMLMKHMAPLEVETIKKEDNDKANSTISTDFDDMFKVEDDYADDDDEYIPDPAEGEDKTCIVGQKRRGRKKGVGNKAPKKIFYCDKCPSKFTSPVRLEHHKQKHEDDGKPPYICEVCGAHYKHKRACDIHVALHKGISDWKCEECNKLFPSKGALQRHNNIHTGKLNYQCDLCGKSFIHTSSFKMHKLSHSGVKPHSCDVCGLALMTRSHLKRHKRVHSGEKRHECPVCGKRFSERYNLLAHSKSHEPNAPTQEPNGQPPERRRMFRCPYCQERYERRYMLERHVSVVHGRSLERPPPTPRNTMSKLLKAQAQRRAAQPLALQPDDTYNSDTKDSQSPEARTSPTAAVQKLTHITTSDPISAWTNAYAAEFGLRQDYAQ
ncbi:unnamed protein product [Leptosia nina]|uniref:C2H2-type domain-containing protein n=1 Tax=Leptosia nina TaxID=320188 RepID=A0AAV1IZ07_9NEOP